MLASTTRRAIRLSFLIALIAGLSPTWVLAANKASPLGEPVPEAPTLHCLGAYWLIQGDDNKNAVATAHYRKVGSEAWTRGPDLFRVANRKQHGDDKYGSSVKIPEGAFMFAGSVFILEPDTAYELKLTLTDPDGVGDGAEKILKASTLGEPKVPAGIRTLHVTPGNGGGSGTKDDPFKGLVAAQKEAKPGTMFLLQEGVYEGTFTVDKSGAEGKPIVWRGVDTAKVILDGKGGGEKDAPRGISCGDVHDVWFENLTVRHADYGIVAHRSYRMTFRRLKIHEVEYGITWTNNSNKKVHGNFVLDCVLEGRAKWPRSKGIEGRRGIQATGRQHVVAYNRISAFADAIDTFPSPVCEAMDFHNNEISEQTDDGIEMDYSRRNTRCFHNRLTNIYQGITTQPVFGGPVYIFRNAMYNVCASTFKMHNNQIGALMIHNTSVKKGMALKLSTSATVTDNVFRNNLFIGTTGNYAFESTAHMVNCDFDYDGFGGGPWRDFLKWNKVRYKSIEEVKAKAPVYKHAVAVDAATAFAGGAKAPEDQATKHPITVNDLRLNKESNAVDAGTPVPGFNVGFAGEAPDLGCYEVGQPVPHYGPRPK